MFLPFTFTVKELSATFFQNAAFMEQDRVELSTPALSERCSNQLSYCSKILSTAVRQDRERKKLLKGQRPVCTHTLFSSSLRKGGDPAALSSTTTLLRLHPPHGAYLGQRPPCG